MTPAEAKRLEAIKERAAKGLVQVVRSDGLSCVVAGFSDDVQFLVEKLEAAQREIASTRAAAFAEAAKVARDLSDDELQKSHFVTAGLAQKVAAAIEARALEVSGGK